ncbi:hypothetical protein [Curvivirga sp.]|uniref:hypothetical protein n=1 Tax=Curvivirga sp. TaxID=2856848 RepID=UPI003B5CC8BE
MHQEDEADISDIMFHTNNASSFKDESSSMGKDKSIWSNLAAWSLFGGGCAAIVISVSGYPIREKVETFYDELFVDQKGYTSIIKDQDKENPVNVREILGSLGDNYSPNLLLKLTREELHNTQNTQVNIQEPILTEPPQGPVKDKIRDFIAPPPTAEIAYRKANAANSSKKKAAIETVEIENTAAPTTEKIEVENTTTPTAFGNEVFYIPAEAKAPLRPTQEPEIKNPKEYSKAIKTSLSDTPTTKTVVNDPIKLEDLIYGMNWNSSKATIKGKIIKCIAVTESIDGCRLEFESWLPNTRHIIGLFDKKDNDNLIAIQVDSFPFDSGPNVLESFDSATKIINGKLSNSDAIFKEQLITDPTNIFVILNSNGKERHFRHWSLTPMQIPAYIHTSIRPLNSASAFHRTLFIETNSRQE